MDSALPLELIRKINGDPQIVTELSPWCLKVHGGLYIDKELYWQVSR